MVGAGANCVPALAVALAAYAPEGVSWGAVAGFVVIAVLSFAYYHMMYDEVRPPSVVSLAFHRPRPRAAEIGATGSKPAAVDVRVWRDTYAEVLDDANAIANPVGGMCGRCVFLSHGLADIAIVIALSAGDDDPRESRKRARRCN